jgi:phosphate transport system substrate-binding protein
MTPNPFRHTRERSKRGMPLRSAIRLVSGKTLATLAVALTVLAAPAAAGAVTLIGSGSSAAQPYMLELFKGYSRIHHNVRFKYIADGGNAGVKDVQSGRSQFSINTRPPEPSDAGTTYVKLFLDALCVAVNRSNSISSISVGNLKNIFLGVDNNWSQVPGSSLSTTIDPIGRNSAAGQYTFFQQSVLGGATQASNVAQDTSDGLVQVGVEKDQNAMGYVGLAHSVGSGEKAIAVNGIPCQARYVRNKSYPLFRFDWGVIATSHPSVAVEQFFDWVRVSAAAGTIINRAGAVAAFNK